MSTTCSVRSQPVASPLVASRPYRMCLSIWQQGELLALIGPNGAGKTTCFNMLNGQLKADAGEVTLNGKSILGLPPRRIWRNGRWAHLPDHRHLSVHDGARKRADGADLASPARPGYLGPCVQPSCGRSHAAAGTGRHGRQADRAAAILAYGDLKRLELAIALAHAAKAAADG